MVDGRGTYGGERLAWSGRLRNLKKSVTSTGDTMAMPKTHQNMAWPSPAHAGHSRHVWAHDPPPPPDVGAEDEEDEEDEKKSPSGQAAASPSAPCTEDTHASAVKEDEDEGTGSRLQKWP